MAVEVIRDARVYHAPTCQFHDIKTGQVIEGDFANYLEANARDVVKPAASPAADASAEGDAGQSVAEGSTDPLAPTGVGTAPVLTGDALLEPLSLENAFMRQGAAYWDADTSLPPGTPDPVQLMNDGRSAMATTVPVTVTTDAAVGQIPGSGNQNRARTQVEGRLPNGSNIVSENGSDEGPGVVVIPKEAQESILVEPVTNAVISQQAPIVEGAGTPATAVDGVNAGGNEAASVEISEPAADSSGSDESDDAEESDDSADSAEDDDSAEVEQSDEVDYDPSEHTAAEVIAYAKDHPEHRDALRAAEQSGKARTTVLHALAS